MALILECIQTAGIAELSYLVGDDADGVAAVFDPRPDVDCYLELARAKQVSITHIFETHIHADLVSGALELAARVETAKKFLSHEGGARYDFDHEPTRIGANVIGGLLFGAGFALLGYCPGTAAGALGQGSWDALFGMAGLVAGSWVFAELSAGLKGTFEKWGDLGEVRLPDLLHIPRGVFVAIFGVLLTVGLIGLERVFPR